MNSYIFECNNNLIDSRTITWKKEWMVSSYESAWGIIEKYKFANAAKIKEVFTLLGIDDIQMRGKRFYYRDDRDLYKLSGLDGDKIKKHLGSDFKERNIALINGILRQLPWGKNTSSYLHKVLVLCPECIKYGFHSILHQITLFNNCPFHGVELISRCPQCNREHIYKIADYDYLSAFQCVCGYFWGSGEMNYNFTRLWQPSNIPIIKEKPLLYWIDKQNNTHDSSNDIFFDKAAAKSHGSKLFEYIGIIDNIKNTNSNFLRKCYVKQFSDIPTYLKELSKVYEINYNKYNLDDLFLSSYNKIKSSIARYLRRHVLSKHQFCFKSYLKKKYIQSFDDNTVCPYAYAYVMWRQSIENLDYFWQVHYRFRAKAYTSPGWSIQYDLYENLINIWEYYYNSFNAKDIILLIQCYEKIISHLILNHYICWLKRAQEILSREDIRLLSPKYEMRNGDMPFYALKLSQNPSEKIEIYLWYLDNYIYYLEQTVAGLNCPFNTKRKKKIETNNMEYAVIKTEISIF